LGSWRTLTHYHFSFNLDFISFLSLVHLVLLNHFFIGSSHSGWSSSYDTFTRQFRSWSNLTQSPYHANWVQKLGEVHNYTFLNPKANTRQQIWHFYWHLYVQVNMPTCIVVIMWHPSISTLIMLNSSLKCHHIIYLALIHVPTWRIKPKCTHLSISCITCGNYPHQHGSHSIQSVNILTMSFTWHLSISTWIAFKSKCQHLWMSLNGTQSMSTWIICKSMCQHLWMSLNGTQYMSTWIICKSMCQQLFMSLYGTLSMSSCVCLRYKNWFPMTKCRQ
jgi:hypothetical protein